MDPLGITTATLPELGMRAPSSELIMRKYFNFGTQGIQTREHVPGHGLNHMRIILTVYLINRINIHCVSPLVVFNNGDVISHMRNKYIKQYCLNSALCWSSAALESFEMNRNFLFYVGFVK